MAEIKEQNVEPEVQESILTVTPLAATKIQELFTQRGLDSTYALRVFVAGGGCSGMQYGMAFEANPQETDTIVETKGLKLVIDPTSLMYVQGAVIDFVDALVGGGFRIDNPNAVSSCGCGSSFKPKNSEGTTTSEGGCSSCSH
ncbi:MAG: iron-sulfur cluster insertion protein ErpA [Phototrophicales bacterium]|nr:MAG: iron-sulfur cluster insertion protein ErpA [Phototrophicales bacterium]